MSLIYRNIFVYRLILKLLFKRKENLRFKRIKFELERFRIESILELCFGDIQIAEYCKNNNLVWFGIDSSRHFVKRARRFGYECLEANVLDANFKNVDLVLIMGSLYHFHKDLPELIEKIFLSSNLLIILEPTRNLISTFPRMASLIAWLTRTTFGSQKFRYNFDTLINSLLIILPKCNLEILRIENFEKETLVVIGKLS